MTMSGIFGGKPDQNRVYLPGLKHYFIDDIEVTKEQFVAEWNAENPNNLLASQ